MSTELILMTDDIVNGESLGGDGEQQKIPYPKFTMSKTEDGRKMDLFITDRIWPDFVYSIVCSQMIRLTEKDTVRVHIHTPGGDVGAGRLIAHALNTTKARTIGRAAGDVMSCGTFIFCSCQEHEVVPESSFLFHPSRGLMAKLKTPILSKFADIAEQAIFPYVSRAKELGILNNDEYTRLTENYEDIYISGSDVAERMGIGSEGVSPDA